MNSKNAVTTKNGTIITNPPFAQFLFEDKRLAIVWLVIRVLLGYQWLSAGWGKLTGGWLTNGDALQKFWTNALAGQGTIKFDWYRGFLQALVDSGSAVWFAKLISIGEFAVGVALILGAFVGVAAVLGGFMNWNYIMAGTASTNGLLFLAAVLLILAWKTAGYYGLDYFLLPRLGTPWQRKAEAEAKPPKTPTLPNPTGA